MPSVTDTPPEIAEMVRARLMALSDPERFLMGVRMCAAARRMVLASLAAGLPESERKRLLFERFYGELLPLQKSKDSSRREASERTFAQRKAEGQDCGSSRSQFAEKGAEVYAKA